MVQPLILFKILAPYRQMYFGFVLILGATVQTVPIWTFQAKINNL